MDRLAARYGSLPRRHGRTWSSSSSDCCVRGSCGFPRPPRNGRPSFRRPRANCSPTRGQNSASMETWRISWRSTRQCPTWPQPRGRRRSRGHERPGQPVVTTDAVHDRVIEGAVRLMATAFDRALLAQPSASAHRTTASRDASRASVSWATRWRTISGIPLRIFGLPLPATPVRTCLSICGTSRPPAYARPCPSDPNHRRGCTRSVHPPVAGWWSIMPAMGRRLRPGTRSRDRVRRVEQTLGGLPAGASARRAAPAVAHRPGRACPPCGPGR